MEIKRPGLGLPPLDRARGPREAGKPQADFAAQRRAQAESSAPVPESSGILPGVAARFTKADLRDPDSLEAVLQSAIQELLLRDARPLNDHQRAVLGDWMRNDPLIRRQLERYLEKILP